MTTSDLTTDRHNLWLTRFYFALYYGGVGFMMPFLNLLYIELGLTGTEVGWITSVASVVTLIAAPFWANRNEKWRNPRGILQLFLALTALSYLLLAQQTLFIGIAIITIFRALVGAGIMPLSDSLALTITRLSRVGYGSVRVWGSVGWIVFVPLSGFLVERLANTKLSLIGAGVITAMAALILFPVEARHFAADKSSGVEPSKFRDVIGNLLRNRSMIGIALMVIFVGIGNSGPMQFENVYLKELGASGTLIGVAGTLSAIVELPFMLWADRLAKKRGAYRLLLISMLIFGGIRLFVWLVPSIITIMIARTITGIAFSFYTIGWIQAIDDQTAPNETRTVLALYTITLANLVSIIASPISGAAYDLFGAQWLYVIAAVGYFAAWLSLKVLQQKPESVVEQEPSTKAMRAIKDTISKQG